MSKQPMGEHAVVLFTKPARPGRVKTRLIGELSPEQAAEIHAAFRDDVCERLGRGAFHFEIAWALEDGEGVPDGPFPECPVPGYRQVGENLGARLHHALGQAAQRFDAVAAVGSDHPELTPETIENAFSRLDDGADIVLGPVPDGGYFLIGLRASAVHRELFEGVAGSTSRVLTEALARAKRLGLKSELLPKGHDIDRPDDLEALALRLAASNNGECPRTRRLLKSWGRI